MRRRVLLVNYEFPPVGAGAGNAMQNIARCLAASGSEVMVLTAQWDRLPSWERRDGYLIRRVPSIRRRADRCSPFEMLTFVLGGAAPTVLIGRSWQPDVACAFFGVPSGPLTLFLRRLFGTPYLVSLRGGDVPGFLGNELGTLHRVTWPLTRAVWRQSSGLIANSNGLADLTRRAWPTAPIEVIPNGVDVAAFQPPERFRPATPLRLLCVGRLVSQKGIRYLLEGLASARSAAVLRVVGDGPERGSLERLAASLDVTKRCDFVGWATREQLLAHYQWADALVLPSLEEGMANVVLEAMAAGLAVVSTDIYGNRGLVEPFRNGLLVPPGNAQAVAEAIKTLEADPNQLQAMGRSSRASALTRSWEACAERYRVALEAAARPRPEPRARIGAQ